jgi:hypothetical protein
VWVKETRDHSIDTCEDFSEWAPDEMLLSGGEQLINAVL